MLGDEDGMSPPHGWASPMIGGDEFRHVACTVSDGVARLTLRRPEKRNAVTAAMWEAVLAHLDSAAARSDVRVLLVQGSERVFCAGADLSSIKRADGTASDDYVDLAVRAFTAVADFPAPSVACIEGPCMGAGCSLALACDLRFAHPSAFFAVPAVKHGIVYDTPSVDRLSALLGPSRAGRMLFTAERIDARRAADIGLVDDCAEDLDRLVTDFVDAVRAGDAATVLALRRALRPPTSKLAEKAVDDHHRVLGRTAP